MIMVEPEANSRQVEEVNRKCNNVLPHSRTDNQENLNTFTSQSSDKTISRLNKAASEIKHLVTK